MPIVSAMYNASFNSHSFLEDYKSGFSAVDAPREIEYAVIHIPGGNTNIVQRAGQKVRELTLACAAEASDMTTLAGDLDTSASLVYSQGTVTARLVAVTDRVIAGAIGVHNATLKFVLS